MYVNEQKDTLYVYLVPGQTGDALTVDEAISEVLGNRRPPQHKLRTIVGQFTFQQLYQWLDRLSPEILAMPGAVSAGIDAFTNRLTVGIDELALLPAVEAELARSGIPIEAVTVEETPPAVPAKTLQSYWRKPGPFGGVQIAAKTGGCTLGFDALRFDASHTGVRGFVTNDHCTTNDPGHGAGAELWQPTIDFEVPSKVGAVPPDGDPCWWPSDTCPAPAGKTCPKKRRCRFSDSAFVAFDKEIGIYPLIAKPEELGSINWNGTSVFVVIETGLRRDCEIPGCIVQKVGKTTGWTQGEILRVGSRLDDEKDHTTLYDQGVVRMQTKDSLLAGDSGSPVFGIVDLGTGRISLLGIAWGSNYKGKKCPAFGPFCEMYYSPIENILMELGPMKVCDDSIKGC
jgi:hypothetical protein